MYMEYVWDRIFQKIYDDAWYYSQHKLLLIIVKYYYRHGNWIVKET